MDMIPSFSVDHTKIVPGVYVSRMDKMDDKIVTTYDVRMKHPNIEPCVDVAAMHTLEHIIATYLRNDEEWKDNIIYWGPMGCLTGFYLILKGAHEPKVVGDLLLRAFEYAADFNDEVPGATAVNCGTYLMHNLIIAKYEAKLYANILKTNPCFDYPKTERMETKHGDKFFDS